MRINHNEEKMTTKIETVMQTLSLLRSALWQTPVESLPFAVVADWDGIGRLALQQTVGPLVLTSALTMEGEGRPGREWVLKALGVIERNRRTHALVDATVADAFARLRGEGMKPVLLKGQAYARLYPDPTLRQCGDIDIYVGEDDFVRAYRATKAFGWRGDEHFSEDDKHYGCFSNGVRIELHRVAAKLPLRGEMAAEDSALFDVTFVFVHLYHHFLSGGVGLRQLCDWAMLLHHHRGKIDERALARRLKEYGVLQGWKSFAPILVEHLGLPETECLLYSPKYSRRGERALSFIIEEGNFGKWRERKGERPGGYFAGKLYSLGEHTAHLWRKLRIDPYTVLRYYSVTVINGTKTVIGEIKKC